MSGPKPNSAAKTTLNSEQLTEQQQQNTAAITRIQQQNREDHAETTATLADIRKTVVALGKDNRTLQEMIQEMRQRQEISDKAAELHTKQQAEWQAKNEKTAERLSTDVELLKQTPSVNTPPTDNVATPKTGKDGGGSSSGNGGGSGNQSGDKSATSEVSDAIATGTMLVGLAFFADELVGPGAGREMVLKGAKGSSELMRDVTEMHRKRHKEKLGDPNTPGLVR